MHKTLGLTVLLLALVPLTGCAPSADDLMQQHIDQFNKLADAMESGADQAKLDAVAEEMKLTKEAIEGLKLSDAEKKRLAEKYGKEAKEAGERVMKATMKKMGGAMQGMMKGLQDEMQNMPKGLGEPPQMPQMPQMP
ncbi:MAG: hypothetical protein JXB62_21600 [Pirellulales bacterium]|nr:hypothetical protein [Pirellulales bacterium]